MNRKIAPLAFAIVLVVGEIGRGSVGGILEDFSGFGPFEGLHTEGWIVSGDGYFEDDGYRIINQGGLLHPEGGESDIFRLRNRPGNGSFRTILEFRYLELSDVDSEMASVVIQLGHILSGESGGVGISVRDWSDNQDRDSWQFSDFRSNTNLVPVPQANGTPVRMVIDFDAADLIYSVSYDPNAEDETNPIAFGPFPYPGEIAHFQREISISTGAFGVHTLFDGLLDYFSVLPLDAAPGDFSGDGELDLDDLEMMTRATRIDRVDSLFDLDGDTQVDANDIAFWVRELGNSYIGDANLDGEFNSSDLVLVFNAGEYEDDVSGASIWYSGDWNGDGDFTTADLVFAFQDAGYEMGPRPASHAIPEPASIVLALTAAYGLISTRRRRHWN